MTDRRAEETESNNKRSSVCSWGWFGLVGTHLKNYVFILLSFRKPSFVHLEHLILALASFIVVLDDELVSKTIKLYESILSRPILFISLVNAVYVL